MSAFLNRLATPLVTAFFIIVLISGGLMFFHLAPAGLRGVHEWLGLVLVLPFALHLWKNWRPFRNYLRKPVMAVTMLLALLATGAFVLPAGNGAGRAGPPQFELAHLLLQQSPDTLATILGVNAQTLREALAKRGVVIHDGTQPLSKQAVGHEDGALTAALLSARKG